MRYPLRGFLWVFACAALPTGVPAADLIVEPAHVLDGDPISIRIVGAPPGALATVHAQSVKISGSGTRRAFYGHATYRVGEDGSVDLERALALSGSYVGRDIHGLFWSQEPALDGTAPAALPALADPRTLAPDQIVLTLQIGGRVEARKVLTLDPAAANVTREEVRASGLVGAIYTQAGARKRPTVIILHGAEGGLGYADWLGPKLASRGYTVFGLVYFSPASEPIKDVPAALNLIPVEDLQRAYDYVATRPEADTGRIGLVGASKGGEFALLGASTYPWIDAVAAFVPSALVTQGFAYGAGETDMSSSWSVKGHALPFLPQTGMKEIIAKYRVPGGEVHLARVRERAMRSASPKLIAAATIPVERSHAAFLLVGGGDDQTGASGESVARVARRLKRHGYARTVEALIYPGAGHLIVDTGWRPTTTHNSGPSQDGGNAEADAHAQADSWTRMLDFLARTLHPNP